MAYISGPATCTYKSVDVGEIRDGFRLIQTQAGVPVTGDDYADSVQELIYRGGNCFMVFTLNEFSTTLNVLTNYGACGLIGQVGRQAIQSSLAGALVLTAVAGTPAASTPATLTATNAIMAEDFDIELLFDSRLREVPVRMRLLPFSSTGQRWWTFT